MRVRGRSRGQGVLIIAAPVAQILKLSRMWNRNRWNRWNRRGFLDCMFICRAVPQQSFCLRFPGLQKVVRFLYLITIVLGTKYFEKNNQWLKVDDFLPGDKIQTRNSVLCFIGFSLFITVVMWSVKLHICILFNIIARKSSDLWFGTLSIKNEIFWGKFHSRILKLGLVG